MNKLSSFASQRITGLVLTALVVCALAYGGTMRIQAAPANQQDNPDSPIATPTWTPTLFPSDTPPAEATATPVVLSTDTPIPLPTDTPFLPATATPVAPPAAGETPVLPPVGGELAPSATAQPILPPPPFGPTATPTIVGAEPLSPTLLLAPGASLSLRERIDPVLFIDNLVVATGYVWLCFATLAILTAAVGAILWVTRRRNRAAAIAALPSAPNAPPAAPAAPATSNAPRVAARRKTSPPRDDFE